MEMPEEAIKDADIAHSYDFNVFSLKETSNNREASFICSYLL